MNIDFNEYSLGGTVGGYSSGSGLRRKPTNPVLDKSHPIWRGVLFDYALEAPGLLRLLDTTGNRRHASQVGTAQWGFDSQIGPYLKNTATPDYYRLAHSFGDMSNSSFAVWYKHVDPASKVSASGIVGAYDAYELFVGYGASNVRFNTKNTSFGRTDVESTTVPVLDGRWHHICGIYDQPAGFIEIFVDGVAQENAAITLAHQTNSEYGIGASVSGGSLRAADPNSRVARATMWGRTLTEAEIRMLASDPGIGYASTSVPVAFGAPASNAVTASMSATRTSGVAPLSMHLDGSASTDASVSDAPRDLDYWWSLDGIGFAGGCCAGLVIEEPGTYTVSLLVTNAETGDYDTDSVSVTVSDPDTVYASTDTVCLSVSGDFTGAPSGASEVTVADGTTIETYLGSTKRVLLHRGETFSRTSVLTVDDGEYLGAYGTIAAEDAWGVATNAPVVSVTNSGGRGLYLGDAARVVGVHVTENGGATAGSIGAGLNGQGDQAHVLLHRCQISGFENQLTVSISQPGYWGVEPTEAFCISKTRFTPATSGTRSNVGLSGNRAMALGCYFEEGLNAANTEHQFRVDYSHKLVVHGCTFDTAARTDKHILKIHHYTYSASPATGWAAVANDLCVTENVLVADNLTWSATFGPQNGTSDERIDGVYFARNHFTYGGASAQSGIVLWCKGAKLDSNVFVRPDTDRTTSVAVSIGQRGVEPQSERLRMFHNVSYSAESGGTEYALVSVSTTGYTGTQAIVRNNVAAGDVGDATSVAIAAASASVTGSNNVDSDTSPGFVGAASGNFRLATGSALIDAGTAVPVYRDFRGFVRDASPDIGAYEYVIDPISLSGTINGDDVDLEWNLVTQTIDGYEVQRRTNGGSWETITVT